jgi:hypothetical protein
MSVSRLLPAGGANDFNVAVGGTYTSVTFDKEYSPGAYTMESALADATYDIYVFNASGSLVGYTKSPSLTASAGFIKMVILGGTTSDLLSFSYKTTYTTTNDSDEVGAGPVFESCTPTALPDIDNTTTITGRNFASNATVTFTGTGYSATAAKAVVRNSATSLTVTRPDNFPSSVGSYNIVIENPGVTNPTGTNAHIGTNAVNGGTAPNWTTGTSLPTFTRNVSYTTTLVASDDGTDVDYVITSGSLPSGLSLDGETGVISGTPTTATNVTFTVRAMDAGGNYADRTFTMLNAAPTWTTAAGAITAPVRNFTYSFTFVATDDSGTSPTYSLASGAFPTGLSLASNGVLSGTATVSGSFNFTVRASDANSNYTDRAFSCNITQTGVQVELVGASGGDATGGSGSNAGGNGARLLGQFIVSPGTYYYYCGSTGSDASGRGGAGGGGQTFFGTGSSTPESGTPLFVAGGGGGCSGQDTWNECSGNPYVGGSGGATIVYSGSRSGGAGGSATGSGFGSGSSGGTGGGSGGGGNGDGAGGGGGGGYGSSNGGGGSGNGGSGVNGGSGGGGGGGGGGTGGNCYRGSPGGGGGGGFIGGNGGTPGSTSAGGGYSYAQSSGDVILHTPGYNNGNGYIIINGTTYTGSGSISL